MLTLRKAHVILLPIALVALARGVEAQGKKGRGDKHDHVVQQQGHSKHKIKKVWTSDEAVDVTRSVLREQGYELVRVERRRDVRVVYYRRGSRGLGRGKGPIMYMIVRPSPDRIIIERAPSPVLVRINVRLGY